MQGTDQGGTGVVESSVDTKYRYTPYRQIEASGAWIAVMTCLRCGATVHLDNAGPDAVAIHDRWHESKETL